MRAVSRLLQIPGMTIAERAEVTRLVTSALNIAAQANSAMENLARNQGNQRAPVDPQIRAGDPQFLAVVIVRLPQPDGSVTSQRVPIRWNGPMTGDEIIAAAIAAAQSGTLSPPPLGRSGGGRGTTTPSGVIISIGRGSPTLGF